MFRHPNDCKDWRSGGSSFRGALSAQIVRLWPFAVAGREDKTDSRRCAADSHNLAGSYPVGRLDGRPRTGEANSSHDPDRELVGCPQELER